MNTERLLAYVQYLMDHYPTPVCKTPMWKRLDRIETYLIKRMNRGA